MNYQALLLSVTCLLFSCESKEDFLMQEKYENQLAFVQEKQAELEEIKKKVQDMKKPDSNFDLDEVKKQIKVAVAENKKLKADFRELEKKKEAAERKLKVYQKMYPIRKR